VSALWNLTDARERGSKNWKELLLEVAGSYFVSHGGQGAGRGEIAGFGLGAEAVLAGAPGRWSHLPAGAWFTS